MVTLGIDSSTQGAKAVVYDAGAGKVVASAGVNYGRDLPEFGSPEGFLPNADPRVRRANPEMWVRGLELVLRRLNDSGAPMGEIAAVGGCAQQHATVCLGEGGDFTRKDCPIWMDSSTGEEVASLDARFGSALRERTGSPAIERFAAAQMMKFSREEPAAYARTVRVHLLSSFLTSLLAGEDAPVDVGDGAGMNLLDLRSLEWDAEICEFAAPGLSARLPRIYRPGDEPLRLAARFAEFGLRPGIPVAPFTGDNPASLVGCGAEKPGCAVMSLGTSDTFFAAMPGFRTDPDGFGHVFGNPCGGFMSLSCFKNGSLARDRVRRECGVDWRFFDETAFALTPPGNGGKRAFPYFETELTPKHDATGIEANFDWSAAAPETKIRAVVEGQVANMRERTRWIGDFNTVCVTGGASRSKGILSAVGDIFGAEVKTLDATDSAAIGGARLAAMAVHDRGEAK
ncbi:MAG: carbohydrate kinase [Kiritimatiellae bacterium]|nr:carbohydrate kinase [Kiritimatiellia bacterium]